MTSEGTGAEITQETVSLAGELCFKTLDKICGRLNLKEHGNPHITLTSEAMPAPVGSVRIFSGERIAKLVYIGMTVPFIKLDSHMIFAFTHPDSPIPHFTLDSVNNDTTYAFHLDLIPRVDLGANLDYIDAVHLPLTGEFEAAAKIEGLSPAHLSPRQYAIMSPWMLAYRAEEDAFKEIDSSVDNYLKHWFSLVETGLPENLLAKFAAEDLAKRDLENRAIIFNPEVDNVWGQVERLVGAEMGAKMREILKSQEI